MGAAMDPSGIRVGTGFDFHRFAPGRKLMLGGVEIPFELGLLGHSDADVLLHAACDAILGALGMGDIGQHYPNTDERYRDTASLDLLADVVAKMRSRGFAVGNLDVTVLAERPRIMSYAGEMKRHIARVLDCQIDVINIKATTMEGSGTIGRGEGIAAQAVVLLIREAKSE